MKPNHFFSAESTAVDKYKIAFLIDSAPTSDILVKLFQFDIFGCKQGYYNLILLLAEMETAVLTHRHWWRHPSNKKLHLSTPQSATSILVLLP